MSATDADRGPAHPAPRRAQVSGVRLAAGLFGAPLAWLAQMSLSEPLSAQGCYPANRPLPAPQWPAVHGVLLITSVLCLLVALLGLAAAWRSWRLTRDETPANAAAAVQSGAGRTRFLAILALMSSGLFVAAILFSALGALLFSACGSAP